MAARILVKSKCILYLVKYKSWWFKTQQLIFGTATDIWLVKEPHYAKSAANFCHQWAA